MQVISVALRVGQVTPESRMAWESVRIRERTDPIGLVLYRQNTVLKIVRQHQSLFNLNSQLSPELDNPPFQLSDMEFRILE